MGRTGGGGRSGGGFSHSSHSSSLGHSSHSTSSRGLGGSLGSFGSRGSSAGRSPLGGGFLGGSRMNMGRPGGPGMGGPGGPGPGMGGPMGGPGMGGPGRRSGGGCMGGGCGCSSIAVIIVVIILCVFVLLGSGMSCVGSAVSGCGSSDSVKSTINRTRLDGVSFTSDCVVDELGWIRADGSSEAAVGSKLETFWKETGIQPYVVLLDYDSAYADDNARYDYAEQYFEEKINMNGALLLMYFDSGDYYTDGTWEMVKGLATSSVMDSEATEIFWNYLDKHWYNSKETAGEAIAGMFNDTAEVIMQVSTTGWDVLKVVAIIVLVIAVIAGIIIILKMRRKQQAEKAAEDERILNTPLENLSADNDPLAQKYADDSSGEKSDDS